MLEPRSLNRRYETIAWGAFLIFLGMTGLIPGLPPGLGTVGVGIILLGLNLARYLSQLPTSGFTVTLGIIALCAGVVDLARALINPEFELPFFPVLIIVIGVIWLVRGATHRDEISKS